MPCKKGKEKCKCEVKCCVERPKCPRFDCDQLLNKKNGHHDEYYYGGFINFGGVVASPLTYSALIPYNHLPHRAAETLSTTPPTTLASPNLGVTIPIGPGLFITGIRYRSIAASALDSVSGTRIDLYFRFPDGSLQEARVGVTILPNRTLAFAGADVEGPRVPHQVVLIASPGTVGYVDATIGYETLA